MTIILSYDVILKACMKMVGFGLISVEAAGNALYIDRAFESRRKEVARELNVEESTIGLRITAMVVVR